MFDPDARGGALLSVIHSYTKNGDPFVRDFASKILEDVSRPFFRFMAAWIYEGELKDPNREFFVESQSTGRDDQEAILWSGRYRLNIDMLPSFLDETFGGKVWAIGIYQRLPGQTHHGHLQIDLLNWAFPKLPEIRMLGCRLGT